MQYLTIKLMSDWSDKVIKFSNDITRKDSVRKDTFTGGQDWVLMDHVIGEEPKDTSEDNNEARGPNTYPVYDITVNVKRIPHYYMCNVVFVMILITLFPVVSSFAKESSTPTDRISIISMLLTAVASKFTVSQNLPKTSFQTFLVKPFILCWMKGTKRVLTDD
ncbi:uncharacterized protein [Diadema setosum]|uniref:uncharacterized protein n=1 Tax=Diadema setosum TaxID=31175 RepID=UPI003B3ADC01